MKIIELPQGSTEWLEWRKTKRMASEVAAMMGESPYQSKIQLARVKRGLDTTPVNFAMARGTQFEPEARAWFEAETGIILEPVVIELGDYGASLDGYGIEVIQKEECKVVVEIKVPHSENSDLWKQMSKGIVPRHYFLQVQQQLMVSGADFAYFVAYMPELKDAHWIAVEHCAKTQDQIRLAWDAWWSEYMTGDLPDEGRNDPDWFETVERYRVAKMELDRAQAKMDEAKSELIELAGNQSAKGCGLQLIKSAGKETVKYAEFVKSLGLEIPEKYKSQGKESFSVKLDKEPS